jgi:WD40 repeat protein
VCAHSHEAGVVALAWHVSRPTVVSASLDRCIHIWDARSGSQLLELTGHTNLVTNFALRTFLGDNSSLPVPPSNINSSNSSNSSSGGAGDGVDVIVSVSDDFTAKVFHLNIAALAE